MYQYQPSDLLSAKTACAQGFDTGSWIFLSMFLCKLPLSVRAQCTAQDFFSRPKVTLQEIAAFADRCTEGSSTSSLPSGAFNVGIHPVLTDVTHPGGDVTDWTADHPCVCSSSARTRELCWYHFRWGDKAKKCQGECTYTPSAKSGRHTNIHSLVPTCLCLY